MKKLLTLLFTLCLILTACGGYNTPAITPSPTPAVTTPAPQPTSAINPLEEFKKLETFTDDNVVTYNKSNNIVFEREGGLYRFCQIWNDSMNIPGTKWLAYREKYGQRSYFIFDTFKLDYNFAFDGEKSCRLIDENTFEITCQATDCVATVDLYNQKVDLQFGPFDLVNNAYGGVKEKNGYKLHGVNGYGPAGYYQVVMEEVATGRQKYIGHSGTTNSDWGFFKNGDVYLLDNNGFMIFDTDMDNPDYIFRLGDKFPFGHNADGYDRRLLLAARRDPGDSTFIAVYFEQNGLEGNHQYLDLDGDGNSDKVNATYMVGLFDKEGRITKTYNTGAYVDYSYFGVEDIYMYLKDKNTLEFESRFKDHLDTRVTLDLNTGKVTTVKGETVK